MRAFPAAYLAAVVAVAASRALTGHPGVHSWGVTPDELATGEAWLLLTSGLLVNGSVVPQLIALALTLVLALRVLGAVQTIVVTVVAHVGATLITYAILLAATGDPDGVHGHAMDYGTSAVWLGLLGALTVASARDAVAGDRRARLLIAVALVTLVGAVELFSLMTATEHALAFALGGGVAALRELRLSAGRSARSGASTASEPGAAA